MKNIQIVVVMFFSIFSLGQVSIGKDKVNGTATILDFNETNNTRGIILSAVNNVSNALATVSTNNNGTFLLDKSDNKIKMYENNVWVALSNVGDSSNAFINTTSEIGEGIIIGSETTQSKGVLVLESDNKAMVLPKIANPHTTVKSPYPGMICYDTMNKALAVFDGKVWNYWK